MIHKPKAVICDLDGTLCNADHRLHHIQKAPKDWDTFFSLCHLDSPHEWCLDLIHALYKTNIYEVIFLTGRNETQREMTLNWLKTHTQFRHEHLAANLYMRHAHDNRHDDVMKREIFEKEISPKYRVMFAIDDRERVIKLWRSLGVPALQCDDWEERDREKGGNSPQEILNFFNDKRTKVGIDMARAGSDQTVIHEPGK